MTWSHHSLSLANGKERLHLAVQSSLTQHGPPIILEPSQLVAVQPTALRLSLPVRALDPTLWTAFCTAVAACPTLESLDYHVTAVSWPANAQLSQLLLALAWTHLRELTVTAGLTTADVKCLAGLTQLQHVTLRHIGRHRMETPVLAATLRRWPQLQTMALSHMDGKDWSMVLDALGSRAELEQIELERLTCKGQDVTKDLRHHAVVQERHAMADFLQQYCHRPYSMDNRLAALWNVRGLTADMVPQAGKLEADYCYHWLRHASDPTQWVARGA